ncbi:methyltransferase family protein [Nonomuraea polychroma]|uniref:Methyltransferase family protein n=1 Tax=Nonomuraea polychroma TaxID=46176 RepID=A0A438LZ26_9ACTN|nr:methyltransferase domain-containing protein [Nonomuraea polychroma]RVX38742.1 methyltransferase family protein [Nonomuraea polychroma]
MSVESGSISPGLSKEEVAGFYDRNNRALTVIFGGNMHYGYWTGPDDPSGLEEAGARLTDVVIGKLGVKPGEKVLDLGCGTGGPGVRLARATGAEVVGVSISTEDVAQASALAQAEGMAEQARFQFGDALALPFEDGSFDAVFAIETLVHVPDRVLVLKEIARVLRPGGRMAVTDYIKRGPDVDDEDAWLALNEALLEWRAAPMVRAEDYEGFGREAGIVIEEIDDITEHTKYTFGKLYAAMRAYQSEHGELPADLVQILDSGAGVDWSMVEEEEQNEGVIIVVGRRP